MEPPPQSPCAPNEPAPSPERRAEIEARALALRRDIARLDRACRPSSRTRYRMAVWCIAIVGLFGALRPGRTLAGGPEAVLRAGTATVGGHRLPEAGLRVRVVPGDVLVPGPEGELELEVGAGRLQVGPDGQVLVERLGPPSLRLLAGGARVLGPLRLVTVQGVLDVPAGTTVEVAHGPGPGVDPAASPFRHLTGAGATWTDAAGLHAVPAAPDGGRRAE